MFSLFYFSFALIPSEYLIIYLFLSKYRRFYLVNSVIFPKRKPESRPQVLLRFIQKTVRKFLLSQKYTVNLPNSN